MRRIRKMPLVSWVVAATVGTVAVVVAAWALLAADASTRPGVLAAVAVAGTCAVALQGACLWQLRGTQRVATRPQLRWEVSSDGLVTSVGEGADAIFGMPGEALTGRSMLAAVHPDDVDRAASLLSTSVARRAGWSEESFRILHADGTARWIRTSGVAQVGDDGVVSGFTATSRLSSTDELTDELPVVAKRVEQVLRDQQVSIVFQPIVCTASGAVIGVEALSRFSSAPQQGPDQWFRDAASTGRGVELELLAVSKAIEAARSLPEHLYLSLNVSPATLLCPGFTQLEQALAGSRRHLILEVTEHTQVDDYEELEPARALLRSKGIRLAVDDAGAGYASFRHILKLRPDVIKLDRGIIGDIDTDRGQRALAAALITYAGEVGAAVIAEGIETGAELAAVTELGVEAVQGYLLGRPTADHAAWQQWRLTGRLTGLAHGHGVNGEGARTIRAVRATPVAPVTPSARP